MERITRENAETVNSFVSSAMPKPLKVKRNGKTKTWKRSPEKFRIPVKYGLRYYFYIDNDNCHLWLKA